MLPDQSFLSTFFHIKAISITAFLLLLLSLFKRYADGPAFKSVDVDLKGKVAIVTGGNLGIGFETVKELALKGCHVVIGARNRITAENAISSIRKISSTASVEYIPLNLADRSSIERFSSKIDTSAVDYLVNNAGIMGLPKRTLTKEGSQMQWAVNHLGHFYLTFLLWPKITRSNFFRIINVSSRSHAWYMGFFGAIKLDFLNINFKTCYDPHLAYSRSKVYNVLFTRSLASKIKKTDGLVVSVNPGVVRTNIIQQMTGNGFKGSVLALLLWIFWPIWCLFTKTPKQGASTTLYAIFSKSLKNGCYYSDCQMAPENPCINEANYKKLWEISESTLKIDFLF